MTVGSGSSARTPRSTFGRFQLQGELGRGGMGVVYRAWDPTTQRTVALKTLLGESKGNDRFEREVEAMGRLRHPNIVGIHETGTVQDRRYFVMDLIEGKALSDRLEEKGGLERGKALEVLRGVALAVHHAHTQGIVHRDLKPSNILLDTSDRPYVLDFGVARILDRATRLTQTNVVVGTLAYMPPEQANGLGEAITPASDVYSLGATLYHALTGRPPFENENRFSLMGAVLLQPPVPPRRHDPTISRDLETVCLRCLEKKPGRRYPSALALALDLERVIEGKPIARPGCARRLGRGLVLALALGAVAALALAAVSAVRARPTGTVAPTGDPAHPSSRTSGGTPASGLADKSTLPALPNLKDKLRATKLLTLDAVWGRAGWADDFSIEGVATFRSGKRALTCSRSGVKTWDLDSGRILRAFPSPRTIAVALLPDERHALASRGRELFLLDLETGASEPAGETAPEDGKNHDARRLALSPDGERALLWCEDGFVRLQSVREPRELGRVALQSPLAPSAVALSPSGKRGAASDGGEVLFFEVGAKLLLIGRGKLPALDRMMRTPAVCSVALSADGERAVTGQADGSIALWDLARPDPILIAMAAHVGFGIQTVAFAGKDRLLAGGRDGQLRIVNAESGEIERTLELRGSLVAASQIEAGGPRLVVVGEDRRVRLIDLEIGELVPDKGHGASVDVLVSSADGTRVLSGSRDETLKLWDTATGHELLTLVGHTADVTAAALSPDSKHAVSAAGGFRDFPWIDSEKKDRTVRFWDLATGDADSRCEVLHEVEALAFSPGGDEVVLGLGSSDWTTAIQRWRWTEAEAHPIAQAREVATTPSTTTALLTLPLVAGTSSPPGTARSWRVLVAGDTNGVPLLTLEPGPVESALLGSFGESVASVTTVSAIAVSRDGCRVAAGSSSGAVRSWAVSPDGPYSPSVPPEVLAHPGVAVIGLALDERGERAVTLGDDATVKIWALPDWRRLDLLDFGDSHDRPRSIVFAGKSLLVGLSGGQILRYSLR